MVKQRNYIIELLRIIAAFAVFLGHFLLFLGLDSSPVAMSILKNLRDLWPGKTLLAFLFEGDLSVRFFFAAGGFFAAYQYEKESDNTKKLFDKEAMLLIPAIEITLIHSLLRALVTGQPVGNILATMGFPDIAKIIWGGTNLSLSYQLWYIHYLAVGLMLLYAIYGISCGYNMMRILLLVLLGVLIVMYGWGYGYAEVLIGAFFGNLTVTYVDSDHKQKLENRIFPPVFKALLGLIALSMFIIVPMIYNEYRITTETILEVTIILSFAIAIIMITCDGVTMSDNNMRICIQKISKHTYSFYIVHAMTIDVTKVVYKWGLTMGIHDSIGVVMLTLFGCTLFTLIMTFFCDKSVLYISKILANLLWKVIGIKTVK